VAPGEVARPAWVWFLIDGFVGGLIMTVVGTIVDLALPGIAHQVQTLGGLTVLVVAIANFFRSPSPETPDRALR
jgi:hypothetical protein